MFGSRQRLRIAALEADRTSLLVRATAAEADRDRLATVVEKAWELVSIESTRCNELLERLLAMKARGATGGQIPAAAPKRKELPADVREALHAVGEPGLEETVRAWIDNGAETEEVVKRIMAGGEVPA